MRARTGKIARLPLAIREDLNLRLLENQTAKVICAWLNSLPETAAVISEYNADPGAREPAGPIDDRNISDWRKGGFADWLRKRDSISETRELSQYAVKLTEAAGGKISDGAAQITAGLILQVLEELKDLRSELADGADLSDPSEQADKSKTMLNLAKAIDAAAKSIAALRKGDQNQIKLGLEKERLDQSGEALALDQARFQRDTTELFIKWTANRYATELANSNQSHADKIEQLGQLMFGDSWKSPDREPARSAPSNQASTP